jgi:hypothetical protein
MLQSESVSCSGAFQEYSPCPFLLQRSTARVLLPRKGLRQNHALVGHGEDEQPVVSLIHDDGKIRKLVYGNAELRGARKPKGADRF